ncbi:MAG: TolC family protein [Planctomycetaceae bacterium]|nr:TolC family protein [Planctomycetota bacterium]NUN51192.1 TolC family protein [Planctomycetaceae bacterium]
MRPPAESGPLPEEPDGPLTLREALALSLLRSPSLPAAALEVRAAEARQIQAGLLPNPEASYSHENVGGTLKDSAERTVLLSQLVELGGKRSARMAVAEGEAELAGWDYEALRLDVLTATARDFVGVLGAQARLRVAEDSLRIAEETLRATRARAEGGAVGPVEVRRIEIDAAAVSIERDKAAADLEGERARLVSNWGSKRPRFTEAVGDLPPVPAPPGAEDLVPLLDRNPDLARFEAEERVLRAELDAAKAGRIPDVTLGAGRRGFEETGDRGYLFEVSMPLPVFDRRQGEIAAAEARLSAVRMRRNAAQQRLRADLVAARAALDASVREAESFRIRIVPWSREVLEATTERYRAGKVGYLELLDARRTYAESAAREAESLAGLHRRRIEIERLIAGPLEAAPAPGPERKE